VSTDGGMNSNRKLLLTKRSSFSSYCLVTTDGIQTGLTASQNVGSASLFFSEAQMLAGFISGPYQPTV
jgi:hypothetical protein